jgi:folate-binding Fe-S cluster repair protein YgfZ
MICMIIFLLQGFRLMQVFVTPTARILDTAVVLAQEKGALAIVSPGMAAGLQQRLQKYIFPMDKVEVKDISQDTRCLATACLHESLPQIMIMTSSWDRGSNTQDCNAIPMHLQSQIMHVQDVLFGWARCTRVHITVERRGCTVVARKSARCHGL